MPRILLLGLLGYLLSVFCWYKTLHKLALSKAYALLSMSYVLVYRIINQYSRLGRDFFAESTTGSSLYYERIDADFPAHDKTTLLSSLHFYTTIAASSGL